MRLSETWVNELLEQRDARRRGVPLPRFQRPAPCRAQAARSRHLTFFFKPTILEHLESPYHPGKLLP